MNYEFRLKRPSNKANIQTHPEKNRNFHKSYLIITSKHMHRLLSNIHHTVSHRLYKMSIIIIHQRVTSSHWLFFCSYTNDRDPIPTSSTYFPYKTPSPSTLQCINWYNFLQSTSAKHR